jgi:hypothetical protein
MRIINAITCIFLFLVSFSIHAQDATFHIIYVDNSKASAEDGLNDAIFEELTQVFENIKLKKNDTFLFMVSDGTNFITTQNIGSVDKMIERAMLKNPQRLPDQVGDAARIREAIGEKLVGFAGKVEFRAYISENFTYKLSDAYSPIFGLLPQELASTTKQKQLVLSINYPKLTGRVKEDVIKNNFNFYNRDEFRNNISYTIKSY